MGRFGPYVNAFALVYTAYVMIWLPFPSIMPITGPNFNYSSPILGAVVLLAVIWWLIYHKRWPGLRQDVIEVATKE